MSDLIVDSSAKGWDWSITEECFGGVAIAGSVIGVVAGVRDSNWAETAVGAAGAAADVASFVMDPIAALASSAAAFLMEYLHPLPDMLDSLAGNPDAVRDKAATWDNIGERVSTVASDFATKASGTADVWTGDAGDAYRKFSEGFAELKDSVAQLVAGVGTLMRVASAVVEIVRTIVRDVVSELVGKLISWASQVFATAGVGAAKVIPEAVRAIARYVEKVRGWIKKVTSAVEKICEIIDKLENALEELIPILKKAADFLDTFKLFDVSSLNLSQRLAASAPSVGDILRAVLPSTSDVIGAGVNASS